ncbi:MAG: efflux RND transporter permease subunit [Candidatus Cryptobacteroides sp.]
MKTSFFIDRPVFSMVISILIVIVGFIGLSQLPIDQYPQIVPPQVRISASYPGASAQTVTQAVATPIEQELNGTPGMLYMESNNTNSGSFTATVTFDISTDPNLAAVEIQNRVKEAEGRLPAEVVQNGISIEKQAASKLMTITIQSQDPKFDEIYLSNYATLNVVDMLRRIPGVGRVTSSGGRYYAMQIWVQPDKLANFGLTVQDLQNALKDQNRESAAGVLGQQPIENVDVTTPITAKGRLSSVSQFEDIVIRATPEGAVIRLRDVARVSLEAQSYNTESGINGGNAAVINVNMLPGANAMDVAKSVKSAMKDISANFPEGIGYDIPFDMTTYISESIHEVYKTLFEALLLVMFVVFLSLQSWRSTLIPMIAVPISLIGTFGVMLVFGFSLNMMTLLGLVLAIGIVVDDAIVVVENVDRIMHRERLSAYEATKKAMAEISGALIATSLVLCAVFVPVSFLSGITGQLFRQFTITIAVSVVISTIVALTLSPVMCSLLLRPQSDGEKNVVFRFINKWLEKGNRFYERMIRSSLDHSGRMFFFFALTIVGIIVLNRLVPQSFIPKEDQGYFTVELELPVNSTLERTRIITERAMDYLMENPDVAYVLNVTGSSPRVGASQANTALTVILKPWNKRKERDINKTMKLISGHLSQYPESKVYVSTPAVIPGLGTSGGFSMVLEARGDATYEDLQRATDTLLAIASQRKELAGLSSSMQSDIPQLYFDVDRDKVKLLGVPVADVFSTLKAFTGSVYINDFNMFNRIYRVYIQADASYRSYRDNLNLFFVKGHDGDMIPVTSLGTTSYTTGPGTIKRFNMFNSSTINGEAAHGYSSGEAMAVLEEIARGHLPDNIGIEWSGLSYQEKKEGGQTGLILGLALLFVFLFLAAQYESWSVPVAVLFSLPIAALGAYLGVAVCGLESNIYFQIGLVMLMGLVAKNAILIVEFAKEEVDAGKELVESVVTAAKLRFRPIVMTSLAFMLGMLPLVLASGPGSASRQNIGTGVFFGMIVAITVGIVFVPFFFVWIYRLKAKFSRHGKKTV